MAKEPSYAIMINIFIRVRTITDMKDDKEANLQLRNITCVSFRNTPYVYIYKSYNGHFFTLYLRNVQLHAYFICIIHRYFIEV